MPLFSAPHSNNITNHTPTLFTNFQNSEQQHPCCSSTGKSTNNNTNTPSCSFFWGSMQNIATYIHLIVYTSVSCITTLIVEHTMCGLCLLFFCINPPVETDCAIWPQTLTKLLIFILFMVNCSLHGGKTGVALQQCGQLSLSRDQVMIFYWPVSHAIWLV